MSRFVKTLNTILFLVICHLGSDVNAEQKRVTLGTILFPPNIQIDQSSGKCVGKNIDVTRQILSGYQIELDVVCASPMRIYKLLARSEVDFTINIKSTRALKDSVYFVERPYRQLVLNLYRYRSAQGFKSVSAIRGFDYNGYRQQYKDMGIEFLDLPNAVSAIQVFVKQQSDALLSYQSPVLFFQRNDKLGFPEEVSVTPLLKIDTHYAIAKKSDNFELIRSALNDYAQRRDFSYFQDILAIDSN